MLRCHGLIAAAALMVLGTIGLASCGGGGGDGDSSPPPNKGSLTIELPDPFDTMFATVLVSGVAFNTNRFTSCNFVGVQDGGEGTGVTVTWTNSAGGGSGTASQSKNCCGFGPPPGLLCNHNNVVGSHNWRTEIPVLAGTNVVTVTARDASGNSGVDTVTITH